MGDFLIQVLNILITLMLGWFLGGAGGYWKDR
jgi:hypothetical protein